MNRKTALAALLMIVPALAGCGGGDSSAPVATVTKEVAVTSPAPSSATPTPTPSDPIPRLFGHDVHFITADQSLKVTSTVTKVGRFTDPADGAMTAVWVRSCVDESTGDGDAAQGLGWWRWTAVEADGTQHDGWNADDEWQGQKMFPFAQQVAPSVGQCFEGWVPFKGDFSVAHVAEFGMIGWRSK